MVKFSDSISKYEYVDTSQPYSTQLNHWLVYACNYQIPLDTVGAIIRANKSLMTTETWTRHLISLLEEDKSDHRIQ